MALARLAMASLFSFYMVLLSPSLCLGQADIYRVSLNGLEFGFDRSTGVLVSLSNPVAGEILRSNAASGGLLDLAYPVESFTGMRLAARSSRARFYPQKNGLRIAWDRMGPSRSNLALPAGTVSAEISLVAAPNGKSVILTCRLENRSQAQIPQILFPDFEGIRPFARPEETRMRVGNQIVAPFAGPARPPGDSSFYVRAGWRTYDASKPSMQLASALQTASPNALRRLDLVGSRGSLSIRNNGQASSVHRILTHRKESSPDTMRLMWEHQTTVKPGEKWESEFWLTPYEGPWVNGSIDVRLLDFNGLEVGVGHENGNFVHLAHSATGQMIEGLFDSSGLLEVEIESSTEVEPKNKQRLDLINRPGPVLSSRDSLVLSSSGSQARLTEDGRALSIFWDELRPEAADTRVAELHGKVSASVRLVPAYDGRSLVMNCRVQNRSKQKIQIVRFPDFRRLQPFHGSQQTRLRLSNSEEHPFLESYLKVYPPEGYSKRSQMLRWIDLGSLKGGLSMFHRQWATASRPSIVIDNRKELSTGLRLGWQHNRTIAPDEEWDSGEIWLTPHQGGWAKGIEVFRRYVQEANPPRPWEAPRHVRDGIGLQTIWMIQHTEPDASKAAFVYSDIPRVAHDALDHGIQELCLWSWCQSKVRLPVLARDDMGGRDGLVMSVQEAKKLGVNVTPFMNLRFVNQPERYGIVADQTAYTFHPELIPPFDPYYTGDPYPVVFRKYGVARYTNRLWQQDVLATLTDWMDAGVTSFSWDVFDIFHESSADYLEVVRELRKRARARDPQSVFQGEVTWEGNIEFSNSVLDYTWNWVDTFDAAPALNVLRFPRLNVNIDDDPLAVKKGFSLGLFLNVMPRKLDQPNATALISEKPAVAAALKEVAVLRRQFLPYFVEGTVLGDSLLSEPASAYVVGHQLENRLLCIVLNDKDTTQEVELESDLAPWLPAAKEYEVKHYDSKGNLLETSLLKTNPGLPYKLKTHRLEPKELALFEIRRM